MSLSTRAVVIAMLVSTAFGCAEVSTPPDTSGGVPIVDSQGRPVGTAAPEAVDAAAAGGTPAPVYRDGDLVGHFGQDGFVPLDES